jgi:WD40 repeat protein
MGNKESTQEKKPGPKDKTFHLQTCEEHDGSINCMDVSDDGSVLVTGGDDSTIRLWTAKTDHVECIGVLEGHEDYITSVVVEDNFIVSTSADKSIRKWNISTCECLITFIGHESTVNKVVCTGDFLFSISYDKKARCWDFDTGECVRVFSGHKNSLTALLYIPADMDIQSDAYNMIQMAKKRLAQQGNTYIIN